MRWFMGIVSTVTRITDKMAARRVLKKGRQRGASRELKWLEAEERSGKKCLEKRLQCGGSIEEKQRRAKIREEEIGWKIVE